MLQRSSTTMSRHTPSSMQRFKDWMATFKGHRSDVVLKKQRAMHTLPEGLVASRMATPEQADQERHGDGARTVADVGEAPFSQSVTYRLAVREGEEEENGKLTDVHEDVEGEATSR
jgi:hypothetical protein